MAETAKEIPVELQRIYDIRKKISQNLKKKPNVDNPQYVQKMMNVLLQMTRNRIKSKTDDTPPPLISKIQPRALNLAKDISEYAQFHIADQEVQNLMLCTMRGIRDLILESEPSGLYFVKSLNEIRKRLKQSPPVEVEWAQRSTAEQELKQICLVLQNRFLKASRILEKQKKKPLPPKFMFKPLQPGEYVQIAINTKEKLRCILTSPGKNAVDVISEAKVFKKHILETIQLLDESDIYDQNLKGEMRISLKKVLIYLSIDSLKALTLKKSISDLRSLIESRHPVDSSSAYAVKLISLNIDNCGKLCDNNQAAGDDAFEKLCFKGTHLDEILEQTGTVMWPWIGNVRPGEDFDCKAYFEEGF